MLCFTSCSLLAKVLVISYCLQPPSPTHAAEWENNALSSPCHATWYKSRRLLSRIDQPDLNHCQRREKHHCPVQVGTSLNSLPWLTRENSWPSEELGIGKWECHSVTLVYSWFGFLWSCFYPSQKESMCLFLHFFTMKFSVSFGLVLSCILLLSAPGGGKSRLSLAFLSHYRENSLR